MDTLGSEVDPNIDNDLVTTAVTGCEQAAAAECDEDTKSAHCL